MSIWDRIRASLAPAREVPGEVAHQLRIASGALLLEMCRADLKILPEEHESIAESIRRAFELSTEETRELLRAADEESQCAVSINIYTSLIQEYSTGRQKRDLIADLWRVAYADGELHRLEEQLVSRVAALLQVSDRVVEARRREVAQAAGVQVDPA